MKATENVFLNKSTSGCWNMIMLYETGKVFQVKSEMAKYSTEILGLRETRWNTSIVICDNRVSGIYLRNVNEYNIQCQGVAFMFSKKARISLMVWQVNLYINSIDFERAFDSVCRE